MKKVGHLGQLYIVSAPSGAGKTSIVQYAVNTVDNLQVSISYTTRPPRSCELNGQDYYFCQEDDFKNLIDKNKFLEYASVYGFLYGTPMKKVMALLENNIDVILEIDWQGAELVKKKIDCAMIYIMPPSLEILRQRLVLRNQDAPEVMAKRLEQAISDMQHYDNYDYLIINDDFDAACKDFMNIVKSNRLATKRQFRKNNDIIKRMTTVID